jgi:hypothetical protein
MRAATRLGKSEEFTTEGAEVTSGDHVRVEKAADLEADEFGFQAALLFLRVKIAKTAFLLRLRHGTVAAIGKGEDAETATVLGQWIGHRNSPKR